MKKSIPLLPALYAVLLALCLIVRLSAADTPPAKPVKIDDFPANYTLADAKSDVGKLKNERDTVGIERDQLRVQLADVSNTVQVLRTQRNDLASVVLDLNAQMAALRQENDHLKGQVRVLTTPPAAPEAKK